MRRPEHRIVFDALEAVLAPTLVAELLVEACGSDRELPERLADLVTFVHGPLRIGLARRLGPAAHDVVDDVLRALSSAGHDAGRPSAEVTRELPLEVAQVLVFVLSSTETLGGALEQALGSARVTVLTYEDQARVERAFALRPPGIVVLDGADFPPIEPADLPRLFASLPPTTVRAIWGTDTPFGAAALGALLDARAPCTPLDRREGIALLVDLVRSRRRGP